MTSTQTFLSLVISLTTRSSTSPCRPLSRKICRTSSISTSGPIFAVARLAGPGRLCLAASAAAVHHEVGVAHHEVMLLRDVMQHRHHVIALDVQRRAALIADQVVMIDALFGELVVGAVPDS